MPTINGGYDQPSHAGSTRLGRNKEITDEWSMLKQAGEAMARSRTSAAGKMRPSIGNEDSGKVVTEPGLSV